MKKLIFVSILAIFCLSLAGKSAYSQENSTSKFIYEYKKELGLTDKQIKNLKDIVTKLQGIISDKQGKLNGLQADLNQMIAESADLSKIKATLNELFQIQADATYENIATTRAIETELTGTQLTKWHSIQAEFMKNAQQAQPQAQETKK